jgi:lipoyl(octanoyl) transferase
MQMDTWRLLITPPARGAWNMALDEAILEACGRGHSLPTLRLYAWEPPCLSLGYAQPLTDVDLVRLRSLGWDLVRRPTGGRAVLHTDELTYSVIAPPDEPRLAGSVLESYNRLAQALLSALRSLGLPADIQDKKDRPVARNTNPVCFEIPSTYEITVSGKKLIGSAQARRSDGVLQHGAIPLTGDLSRILQVLAFKDEGSRPRAAQRLLTRAATIETLLGRLVSWDEMARAMIASFSSVLSIALHPADLSPSEQDRARELVEKKYAHPDWMGR